MRRLVIKNLGPIANADLQLGQVNVLIGMQSSGKSCVLKTACYCAWVEKRLELSQKVNGFGNESALELRTLVANEHSRTRADGSTVFYRKMLLSKHQLTNNIPNIIEQFRAERYCSGELND